MTVTKAVVRGILIASLMAPSAKAGSMLYLGMTPSDGTSLTPGSPAPGPSSSHSYSSWQSPVLRLGFYNGPSSSNSSMSQGSSPGLAPSTAPQGPSTAGNPSPPPSNPGPSSTGYSAPTPPPAPPSGSYDAYINMGTGPYVNSNSLTTGNPQAWYLSPSVVRLYGGVPSASQQSAFTSAVLQRAEQGFTLSGVQVALTGDPNASAAHTLSVVSQTTNPSLGNAIGMTYLGGNGFHYIDVSAAAASSVDQLEWIVAHNVDHELMLAFGVPEVHDQSGNYLDARNASWSMMTNPNATFSPGAVGDLLSRNFQNTNSGAMLYPSPQLLEPSPVPEPTTVALWSSMACVGLIVRRVRSRRPVVA